MNLFPLSLAMLRNRCLLNTNGGNILSNRNDFKGAITKEAHTSPRDRFGTSIVLPSRRRHRPQAPYRHRSIVNRGTIHSTTSRRAETRAGRVAFVTRAFHVRLQRRHHRWPLQQARVTIFYYRSSITINWRADCPSPPISKVPNLERKGYPL